MSEPNRPMQEWDAMDIATMIMEEMAGYDMAAMNIDRDELGGSVSFTLANPVGPEYRIEVRQVN